MADIIHAESAATPVSPVTASHEHDVFSLVQRVRSEIDAVDSVVSYAELCGQAFDYAVVRPMVSQLAKTRHPALLFSLLLARSHYIEQAECDLAFQGVNQTRAALSELLAIKLLALWQVRSFELATILTHTWNPWAGATVASFVPGYSPDKAHLADLHAEGAEHATSAIDLAVQTQAKRFVRCPPVQQFINALYSGQLLYIPSDAKSIVRDTYKSASVEVFDVSTRPILDHYVLRVPKIRRFIDFCTMVILVSLFMSVQLERESIRVQPLEALFVLFTFGFALDELISVKERGLKVYTQQIWNILDIGFLTTFLIYFVVRCVGLAKRDLALTKIGYDILALGACLLFPRLCGLLLRDSFVLIGLRAMLTDFAAFVVFAVICSVGFLLSFHILGNGQLTLGEISWLLVKVFLGSSYLGFEVAPMFGQNIGPALMLVFAIFSNTLLLTILISILSNTFSTIQWNAVDEALFQKAVSTLELVKGDALFELSTPTNLIALPILWPASYLMSSRSFHSFNVLMIRLSQFPILFAVHVYYRAMRKLLPSSVILLESDGSEAWKPVSQRFGRSVVGDLFSYRVTKACKTLQAANSDTQLPSAPVAVRGSGGQSALGVQPTSSPGTSVQPISLLTQIFGKAGEKEHKTAAVVQATEDRFVELEKQLNRIEDMVTKLLTGGISLDNDSR